MVYTGTGGLVYLLFLLQILGVLCAGWAFDFDSYLQTHLWPWLLAGGVNALICFAVGRATNRGLPHRVFVDTQKAEHRPFGSTFCYVRLEYCGLWTIPVGILTFLLAAGDA